MCENSDVTKVGFSVLMSVYIKEKSSNVEECFESLLNQTILADQWVVVKDGPLSDELEKVLAEYDGKYPNLITFVPLEKNVGLGLALREGMLYCRNPLIARMDTDDICMKTRFEKQIIEFINNPELDICGSHIYEFENSIDNIVSKRMVPLSQEQIKKYQKKRSAFNHMTVMFKKQAVLKVGNYEHLPLMEDDLLWTRMILGGCYCKNADDFLVYVRIGLEMIERRGGWGYFKKYRSARQIIYETGFISYFDYIYTIFIQFVVALVPKSIRIFIFTKLLR